MSTHNYLYDNDLLLYFSFSIRLIPSSSINRLMVCQRTQEISIRGKYICHTHKINYVTDDFIIF